ncbi:uncharacterized protein LOC142624883 [Castanea sativa]|uniref:uncharacterized protein LOC142624883 n=1 Tax=Castanea sativa TaxID=21020 RepID=UPI003F64F96E
MIDHVFLPHEAEVIKSIPLSNRPVQDIQIWAFTNTGEYSVKSAYKMIQTQHLRSSHGQSSNHSQSNKIWKAIWAAKVCNKIKTYIWRACRDIFPTKANLTRRKKLFDAGCDCCEDGVESTDNALLSCTYADMVRKSTCLREIMAHSTNLSFVDVVDHIMQRKNDPEIAIFFTTNWMIWNKQNEAHHGTSRPDPPFLAMTAIACALEYLEANYGLS